MTRYCGHAPGSAPRFVALLLALTALCGWPRTALPASPREAAIVSKQALDYYYKGRYDIATELYQRAFKLDPARPEYLYGAARSEHKAGRLANAIALYERLLSKVPATAQHAVKSRHHLASARAALKRSPAPPSKAGPTGGRGAVGAPAPSTGPMRIGRIAGWTALGLGGLGAVGAIAYFASGSAANATLDADLAGHSANDPVTSLTWNQARARREDANSAIRTSWLLAGLGAAGVGVGTWLLLRNAPDDAAWHLSPAGRGVALTARF